jgi:O-antigen/teichoic acid export membrane protein
MDSPVASEADANLWAYGTVAAALVALWRGGWWAAGAAGVAGAVFYFTLGRLYVRRRLRRRIDERALQSLDLWQKLWRFGGIVLTTRGGETCAAPEGNWMALVRNFG